MLNGTQKAAALLLIAAGIWAIIAGQPAKYEPERKSSCRS
jgi:hypothetical protein